MPSELFQKQVGMVATYAHRDIAYHFEMWISPRFQLLLVKEYQRRSAKRIKLPLRTIQTQGNAILF